MNILLQGVVGSTAYGLATPDSDVDRLGMYAAPTVEFHGLHPPVDKRASVVRSEPDITLHEAGKFAKLALGGNPTVMELLWLDEYEIESALGLAAVKMRDAFLSAPRVRDAYLGYATQQFRRLHERGDGAFDSDLRKRTAKHARHLMRLCYQGFVLYSTGILEIKLQDPDKYRDFGEKVAEGNINLGQDLISQYKERFDNTATVLPLQPDEGAVEAWLQDVRKNFLEVKS